MNLSSAAAQMPAFALTIMPLVLDAAVKSVLIMAVAGLAVLCLRWTSAATRHLIWFVATASLLLLPLLTAVLPAWRLLPPLVSQESLRLTPADNETSPAKLAPPAPTEFGRPTVVLALARSGPDLQAGNAYAISTAAIDENNVRTIKQAALPHPLLEERAGVSTGNRQTNTASAITLNFATWSIFLWPLGSLLALIPTLLGTLSLWRLRHDARRITDPGWLDSVQSVLARLQCRRRVILLQSSRRRMPMTWGLFRSRLLLPGEADAWPAHRRELVLLHELAHIKRWDCLTNLITQVVGALYWFNPLVGLAARRMRVEREQACDDLVLSAGSQPSVYAEELLDLSASHETEPFASAAALPMARPSTLETRLLAILGRGKNRNPVSRFSLAVTLALLTAIVVPVAMLQARAADNAETPKSAAAGGNPSPTLEDDPNAPKSASDSSSNFISNAETNISKSFNVTPGSKLSAQVDRGNIDVETSDRSKVEIMVERKVTNSSEAEAAKILKSHQITLTQEHGEIRIRAKLSKSMAASWLGRQPNLNVHYKIIVPKTFDLSLDTGGGNVDVADLQGKLDTVTGGGNVDLGKIQGPVEVRTGGGNVDLGKIQGPVEVRTGGGNISVADCSDKLNLQTGGGNVNINSFSGPSIQAETGGGSITAEFASQPKADSSFSTGGGHINVKLPETAAVNLDAGTGGGIVRTDLVVDHKPSKPSEHLRTTINGGGPALLLRTGGGGIEILKR